MRQTGVVLCVAVGAGACLSGCSDKLLRETVFANTESMIGVTVAQNSQTQLYELKAGFARHELFIVPTDKIVFSDKDGNDFTTQEDGAMVYHSKQGASKTANVIGEIQVGGSSKGIDNNVEIYQRLAVGDLAVQSGAAIALMANDAATAEAAAIVSEALTAKEVTADRKLLLGQIEMLRKVTPSPASVTINGAARSFADGRALGDHIADSLGTPAQRAGNWDLRNFRAKASGEQLQSMIEQWTTLLGL